jgi:hypothetical protein
MFKYPGTLTYAKKPRSQLEMSEQRCSDCGRWFDTTAVMKVLLDDLAAREAKAAGETAWSVPFTMVPCPHCGKSTILVDPGKYDSHRATLASVQRYAFPGYPAAEAAP